MPVFAPANTRAWAGSGIPFKREIVNAPGSRNVSGKVRLHSEWVSHLKLET